ncbi:EAL domain-containing response regulator [Vibrio penaeicida]|uniref:EAL domain-containing response regulator n=1 Tax=Vibrio penaeicida TaxID=104609 RepID=UPI00142E6C2F|nr:EAL domain-containing response regulator [Vibrio penaeicida]
MTEQSFEQLHVLVIDDDPFILNMLERALSSMGIVQITLTTNSVEGAEAISCQLNPVNVVISDLNMPSLDGVELIRHMEALHHSASLILISGEDDRILQTAVKIAQERGIPVLGALSKPINTEELKRMFSSSGLMGGNQGYRVNLTAIGAELRQAIVKGDIVPHYQPQLCIQSRQVVGVEALARWNHPERGTIPPNVFIPIAEKLGLINHLTEMIFKQGIADLARWKANGWDLMLSVNFSHYCLSNLEIPRQVKELVMEHNIPARHIVIEITESLLSKDATTSLDILTRFRLKGFGLSIDDFGTGFSTMEQLQRVPFTELKLDRSFVHEAENSKVSKAIIETSLSLAKKLEISTVAEGVETFRELEFVMNNGCDLVQGYYVSPPMKVEDFEQWLSDNLSFDHLFKPPVSN